MADADPWLERMRRDWDERAAGDAERSIYTRDSSTDDPDFDRSGRRNYDQLVRPFLPVLLAGKPARFCRVVEIGCGIGRMTRWLAEEFGHVDAFDISPRMIDAARVRLARYKNVTLHVGSGRDLQPVPDDAADLVFSYIVFQHIPSRDVIESYVREASRVLKPYGAFKFQLSGARLTQEPDTWTGVSFTEDAAWRMLREVGLARLASEGGGTQYFVVTAVKHATLVRLGTYILPGEAWAAPQLIEGWGEPVEGGWRPVEARFSARLRKPVGHGRRFFIGLWIWPEDDAANRTISMSLDGVLLRTEELHGAGDHYVDVAAPGRRHRWITATVELDPATQRPAAVRCLGLYKPAAL